MAFIPIIENIYLYEDYVNVYVIKNGNKGILIDLGSSEILEKLHEIGIDKIEYILHTHYHRDQCHGDYKAVKKNIMIAASRKERKLFTKAENFWRTKSYYNQYFFQPSYLVSTYNIPLDKSFKGGDTYKWNTYEFKIIETPGHTLGSISYLLKTNNKTIIFSGDLIHSGSKVITYYDLEIKYGMDNGDWGMLLSLKSFKRILKYKPDLLLPSHGEIITNSKKEINDLAQKFDIIRTTLRLKKQRIARALNNTLFRRKLFLRLLLRDPTKKNIKEQFPSIIRPPFGSSLILLGNNQNCILMDFPGTEFPIQYGIKGLEKILKENRVKSIDFIIPTHIHDDHVTGITLLQEKYGTEVYALENMVDVLENPTHYRIPCLMETPVKVDRVIKDGETLLWDDYQFEIFHFPGQTEYHMAMFGEVDGKKVLFAGDSFKDSIINDSDPNFIPHSPCQLGKNMGPMKCADLLVKINPEFIVSSHLGIMKVNDQLFKDYRDLVAKYETIIDDVVAQENVNMGLNPHWIRFKPIRVITEQGKTFDTAIAVKNYLDKKSKLNFNLNLPAGWSSDLNNTVHIIEPNSYQEVSFSITIPQEDQSDGRTILTADITWNGKKMGPSVDLMVDHGYEPAEEWKGWTPESQIGFIDRLLSDYDRDLRFFK